MPQTEAERKRAEDGTFLNAEGTQKRKDEAAAQATADAGTADASKTADADKGAAGKGADKENNIDGLKALAANYLGIEEKELDAGEDKSKAADKAAKDAKDEKDKAATAAKDKSAKAADKVNQRQPPRRPVEKPMNAADIAKAAAEGVATALKPKEGDESGTAGKKEKQADPDADLSQFDKKRLTVLKQMEETHGEKYKGIADAYKTSLRTLIAYQSDWEAKNPDRPFDESDPEHEAFFNKHEIDWDDDDYAEALADMKIKPALEKLKAEITPKLNEYDRKEKLRDSAQIIDREQTGAARTFWKDLGEDFDGIVSENGSVDMAKLKALKEKDPDTYEAAMGLAQNLDLEVAEIYKVLNNLVPFNKDNKYHQFLNDYGQQKESLIVNMDENDKAELAHWFGNGEKTFLASAEFYKLPKEERERKFWTLGHRELSRMRADEMSRQMKAEITKEEEKFKRRAAARGIKLDEKEEKADKVAEAEGDNAGESDEGKPRSPSSGSTSNLAAHKGASGKGEKSHLDALTDSILR